MANLASVHIFIDGEVLTAAQLNALDANIRDNFMTLISPLGGDLDVNNNDISNVRSIVLSTNTGIDPTIPGQILKDGQIFKYFDGAAVRVNQVIESTIQAQFPVLSSIAIETSFWAPVIKGWTLGIAHKVDANLLFRVGLLAGANVSLRFSYGNSGQIELTISNASGVTTGLILCPIKISLWADGATNIQALAAECRITTSQSNVINSFAAAETILANAIGMNIDSTIDQNIHFNVLFSSSDPLNQCDCIGANLIVTG